MKAAKNALTRIREGLELLHGPSSGLVQVCATGVWTGQAFADLDDAAQWAVDHTDREGVYVRCTTLRAGYGGPGRGSAADSYELPGLWADLDLEGPGHSRPPSLCG